MAKTNFRRRRRRAGQSAPRVTPAEAVRTARVHHPVGKAELAGAIVSLILAAVLIVLIWVVTSRTIQDQREQVRDVVQRDLSGQAAIMARTVGLELLVVDQSLIVLQQAWNKDAGLFDINRWKAEMPALMAVADDLFVADEKRIIRQDILAQAVGQGIASAYVSWPHGALEKLGDAAPRIGTPLGGEKTQGSADARRFIMYVIRPLDKPPGWLIGASFRTDQLAKLYDPGWFGANSIASIVDMQNGGLQTIIGPAARRPARALGGTELFTTMTRTNAGTWTGTSPVDGTARIHAFFRVPDRDMSILVGVSEAEAMAPAATFAAGARGLATAATATVSVIAALIAWMFYRLRANRRREYVRLRDATEFERLRQDEVRLVERAQLQSARLRAIIANASDGIALLDTEMRLIRWNPRFEHGIGVPLETQMPLDVLLRRQAAIGLLDGMPDELEAEIAQRTLVLQSGDGSLAQLAGAQEERLLRGVTLEDGSLVLLLTGVGTLSADAAAEPEEAAAEAMPTAAPVEW